MSVILNINIDFDIASIVKSAGGVPEDAYIKNGRLVVDGVSGSSLSAALAAYDHNVTIEKRKQLELERIAREMPNLDIIEMLQKIPGFDRNNVSAKGRGVLAKLEAAKTN